MKIGAEFVESTVTRNLPSRSWVYSSSGPVALRSSDADVIAWVPVEKRPGRAVKKPSSPCFASNDATMAAPINELTPRKTNSAPSTRSQVRPRRRVGAAGAVVGVAAAVDAVVVVVIGASGAVNVLP